MLLLISGATKTLRKYVGNPYVGNLWNPEHWGRYDSCLPLAADNGAYSGFNEKKFIKMLDRLAGRDILFVTAPDVVGNAIKTSALFDKWYEEIKVKRGLPVALVLQDGQEWIGLPDGSRYDALFIGGSTPFKLGPYAAYCAAKGKEQGKWVHMGRVNSFCRLAYAIRIGCDSVDGTSMSISPDIQIRRFVGWLEKQARQTVMFE